MSKKKLKKALKQAQWKTKFWANSNQINYEKFKRANYENQEYRKECQKERQKMQREYETVIAYLQKNYNKYEEASTRVKDAFFKEANIKISAAFAAGREQEALSLNFKWEKFEDWDSDYNAKSTFGKEIVGNLTRFEILKFF